MRRESIPPEDMLYFFVLNISSGFMLSAAHNVLYFVLDVKTTVIHFLHHFATFLLMMILYHLGCIPRGISFSLSEFKLPVLAKFFETALSSLTHSQHRHGELYLVRIFDFMFASTILIFGDYLITSRQKCKLEAKLLVPLTLAASLSWFEPGQLEFSTLSLVCAPLLSIARAVSLLTMQRAYTRYCGSISAGHLEHFCLCYTGFTSVVLFLPALLSYSTSHVELDASWESIDYALMTLSFLFMSCNLYSDLWLGLSLSARRYVVLDHTKYLSASIGQWIIQNMAHPNVVALGGKILAVTCLLRILARS